MFCNLVVLPVFLCTYNLCFIDDDDYSGPLRAIMDGIAPNIYQFIAIYCQKNAPVRASTDSTTAYDLATSMLKLMRLRPKIFRRRLTAYCRKSATAAYLHDG